MVTNKDVKVHQVHERQTQTNIKKGPVNLKIEFNKTTVFGVKNITTTNILVNYKDTPMWKV